jgi:hypothetical protein
MGLCGSCYDHAGGIAPPWRYIFFPVFCGLFLVFAAVACLLLLHWRSKRGLLLLLLLLLLHAREAYADAHWQSPLHLRRGWLWVCCCRKRVAQKAFAHAHWRAPLRLRGNGLHLRSGTALSLPRCLVKRAFNVRNSTLFPAHHILPHIQAHISTPPRQPRLRAAASSAAAVHAQPGDDRLTSDKA